LLVQNHANNGAKATINNGFTAWKDDVGISKPNTVLSINLSVYKLNEEPACSKPAQKNITKAVKIKITVTRCFSSFVKGLSLSASFC
jgi:hypothetical protein